MQRTRDGLYEYQIASTLTGTWFEQGCQRNAYPPIVGAGGNAAVLHYNANRRRMERSELLLIDAAAECDYYASDITRTFPVSGKFNKRQRELYEIVLGAQKAAIAAAKPGVKLNGEEAGTLHATAKAYLEKHGLGKYFVHSLGHHVGLDVHDPTDRDAVLAPNMVVTIEPGVYIPEEGIGIRIEDLILITENGARLMSGALPREADAVERAMRGKR
jgi:Xaa-Pro aminopeptidase